MKYWTGGGEADEEGNGGLVMDVDISDPAICNPYPACHKITYSDDNPATPGINEGLYQWWATCLWDGFHPDTKTNLLRYTHITFEVKGTSGGEDFYIGLQETNKKKFDLQVKVGDFVQDGGITTDWKTVRIPLNKFIEKPGNPAEQPGVNLNLVQAIDFMFYAPESLSGTIYFTNLRLEGAKIDDFEDPIEGENLLRHPSSTGSGRMDESGDIIDPLNPGNKCHKLTWGENSSPDLPGFWYTKTYFEPWNVDEPTDISLYTHLNIRVRSETGGETFNIEFQEAVQGQNPNLISLPSTNYISVTANWQVMSIPLADFVAAGVGDKNNMAAIALFFPEADSDQKTIYIDDIYLSYQNYPPVIHNASMRTLYADYPNSYYVLATDPEGDHLIFSAENLPRGAILDPTSGLIMWKPDDTQKYLHGGIKLRVSDGYVQVQKTISIDVVDFLCF